MIVASKEVYGVTSKVQRKNPSTALYSPQAAQICAFRGENIMMAFYWSSPKEAKPIPSSAAEKNPTSVHWAREDSRKKVGYENI